MDCFKYLDSMLTNYGRCTCEIKSLIVMAKAAFNKKKTLFTSKLDFDLRRNTKNVSFNIALFVGSADLLFTLMWTSLNRIFLFVSSLVRI